ncbi:hypothetical protein C0Q70_14199 [Pomacea canaliculata]|uniref:Uncharacterized protein n=1 Tax=Pomacea canaliculata TaxID=400727 RepID=A0A2T7NZB7_POMCA|nr:hypothetical protein C0Q70_14199 [Pomacea canaliculata]
MGTVLTENLPRDTKSASYFHSPSKIVAAPGAGSISRPLQQRLQSPVRLPLALYAKRSSTALSGKLDVTADEVKVRKAGVTQMVTCVDVDKRLKVEEGARERGSTDDDTINKSGEDN